MTAGAVVVFVSDILVLVLARRFPDGLFVLGGWENCFAGDVVFYGYFVDLNEPLAVFDDRLEFSVRNPAQNGAGGAVEAYRDLSDIEPLGGRQVMRCAG